MNTRSFIFFTRILARAQISSLTSEGFFIEVLSVTILETTKTTYIMYYCLLQFYRSQFWRLQKPGKKSDQKRIGFIGHNFGDYKNDCYDGNLTEHVLSVTILETTKTWDRYGVACSRFYRSQFWRLQKLAACPALSPSCFIGHNFGDYKNNPKSPYQKYGVLSVTILETTKTLMGVFLGLSGFYRSQFWRLQKPSDSSRFIKISFIGHNFGDYKNLPQI